MAFDYTSIFNKYSTVENIPFNMINRSINFPEDKTLPIYGEFYCSTDIAWTLLSYRLYNTIEFWWLLSALNKNSIFYAPENTTIRYIKNEYIEQVINIINEEK